MNESCEMRSILLVEDDSGHAEIIKLCFAEVAESVNVIHYQTGEEALSYLKECAPESLPGLVLLDLRMPTLDGISVLEAIRANPVTRTVPVVILSTSSIDSEVKRAYQSGVNDFLVKPFELSGYMEMVENFCQNLLGRQE